MMSANYDERMSKINICCPFSSRRELKNVSEKIMLDNNMTNILKKKFQKMLVKGGE